MERLFRSRKQFYLFLLMVLSTLFGLSMVVFRLLYTQYDFSQLNSVQAILQKRGIPSFLFFGHQSSFGLDPLYYCTQLTLDRRPQAFGLVDSDYFD